MKAITFEEIFSYPIAEFRKHLEEDINDRILFSGKYGIGKTMFLDNFFKNSSISVTDKYEVYTLFPINYSVASNEDIIRYIKYDILIEFLKKGKEFSSTHLNFLDTFPSYVLKHIDKVAASIVYMVPKIGKDIVDVHSKIEELRAQFLKYHKELNTDDSDRMADYLEEIENREGSVYDNDVVTRFISGVIGERDGKHKILILEDLDRLDPDHVFRILNVFAAHFHDKGEQDKKNKFSFDKVVLVCDFENIRHIFHHKYGTEVDFVGYIDKFYSTEVFRFDNRQAIKSVLQKIFESISLSKQNEQHQYFRRLFFNNGLVLDFVTCILEAGFTNLRSIMKMYGRNPGYHLSEIKLPPNGYPVQAYRSPIIIQIKLINEIIGDYNSFHKIVESFLNRRQHLPNYDNIFKQLVVVLSYSEHLFHKQEPYLFKVISNELFVEAHFDIDDVVKQVEIKHGVRVDGKPSGGAYYEVQIDEFWVAFRMTIELLYNLGYLR